MGGKVLAIADGRQSRRHRQPRSRGANRPRSNQPVWPAALDDGTALVQAARIRTPAAGLRVLHVRARCKSRIAGTHHLLAADPHRNLEVRVPWREALWLAFAAGWIILLLGAMSFGILDLLGIEQMRAWANGASPPKPRLKTRWLYRWLRHPMYVGVLLAVWVTPQMTIGHLLLALYVLIAIATRSAIS